MATKVLDYNIIANPVQNINSLQSIDTTNYNDGVAIFVKATQSMFVLSKNNPLATITNIVVQPAAAVSTDRWIHGGFMEQLTSKGLVLFNQAIPPSAVANSSILFTTQSDRVAAKHTDGNIRLVVTDSSTDTLSNKTISSDNNTITIKKADISDLPAYITASSTDNLTNKTISVGNGNVVQVDAANIQNKPNWITPDSTNTLSNKTISYLNNTISISTSNIVDYSVSGNVFRLDSISGLRALNNSSVKTVVVKSYYGDGDTSSSSVYLMDDTDTVTLDDGGWCIVDASNRRWKLQHHGQVSIRQYGCNPYADCTSKIQAMLGSCIVGNFSIFVPAGTYIISHNLAIPQGCRIIGENYLTSSFLLQVSNVADAQISYTPNTRAGTITAIAMFYINSSGIGQYYPANVIIENVGFYTSIAMTASESPQNVIIENVGFDTSISMTASESTQQYVSSIAMTASESTQQYVLYSHGASDITIRNCYMELGALLAVGVASTTGIVKNIQVHNNRANISTIVPADTTTWANNRFVKLFYAQDSQIINNTVNGGGIRIYGGANVLKSGETSATADPADARVSGAYTDTRYSSNIIISNNIIRWAYTSCISLNCCENSIVSENTIRDAEYFGIVIEGCKSVSVQRNIINNSMGTAMALWYTNTAIEVSGNIITMDDSIIAPEGYTGSTATSKVLIRQSPFDSTSASNCTAASGIGSIYASYPDFRITGNRFSYNGTSQASIQFGCFRACRFADNRVLNTRILFNYFPSSNQIPFKNVLNFDTNTISINSNWDVNTTIVSISDMVYTYSSNSATSVFDGASWPNLTVKNNTFYQTSGSAIAMVAALVEYIQDSQAMESVNGYVILSLESNRSTIRQNNQTFFFIVNNQNLGSMNFSANVFNNSGVCSGNTLYIQTVGGVVHTGASPAPTGSDTLKFGAGGGASLNTFQNGNITVT